ncbi:hypothetical protein ACFFV7_53395 [Nonomuraea spiralis]|uniref:Uncharacterized protein n=1 Tax=Nonomuraea spiralis TaxID=46182 RepID=A0ABV5J1K8_9ACTN|nr:hypothetical protein [Nonomuraea spiralis]GGT44243.1 hypothetical protein GCM10010176_104610 [Nonomuraea spiralis]
MRYEFVDGMKDMSPPLDMNLTPVTPTVFAATGAGASFSEDHMPVVFSTLSNGTSCVYVGSGRRQPAGVGGSATSIWLRGCTRTAELDGVSA